MSSVASPLAGTCVLTGRYQAQKKKCFTFLPNVWFWGFVVEEFEGLAHLG